MSYVVLCLFFSLFGISRICPPYNGNLDIYLCMYEQDNSMLIMKSLEKLQNIQNVLRMEHLIMM